MPDEVRLECTNLSCGNEWLTTDLNSVCPICGATGRIKPPAPPGGTKVEG